MYKFENINHNYPADSEYVKVQLVVPLLVIRVLCDHTKALSRFNTTYNEQRDCARN